VKRTARKMSRRAGVIQGQIQTQDVEAKYTRGQQRAGGVPAHCSLLTDHYSLLHSRNAHERQREKTWSAV
jgi:hypothetical protein